MPYKSKKDLSQYQADWLRRRKEKAIALKGGKCKKCGYKGHQAVFQFHHRNPAEKDWKWSVMRGKAWPTVLKELAKCDLLCANCHAVVHSKSKYD